MDFELSLIEDQFLFLKLQLTKLNDDQKFINNSISLKSNYISWKCFWVIYKKMSRFIGLFSFIAAVLLYKNRCNFWNHYEIFVDKLWGFVFIRNILILYFLRYLWVRISNCSNFQFLFTKKKAQNFIGSARFL